MRGVVVPSPTRSADLRAWYSGDRFPIISCLCRSQLCCPRWGVSTHGAHPSGQVGVACAARHDIPHRLHHQRVWPGVSGRRVKCPRISEASSAASNGRTIRAGIPATGGPGLGSTSPHVAREPRPVGTGWIGGGAVHGCSGSASDAITEWVMRISSWVGGRWQDSKWASNARPPSAAGRVWRHRVQRHTGHPFPTSHHLLGLPSGPSTAGSRGSNLPVAISKRISGGGGVAGAWGGTRGDPRWARVHLHVTTRWQSRGPPSTPFPGWWLPTCGKPRGGPPFRTGKGIWGRANNINKRE